MHYEMELSTGKKVVVREPEVGDEEKAAQAVGERAGSSNQAFAVLAQVEIVKQLVISVNGQTLSLKDKHDLKAHLNYAEYNELVAGVTELLGKPKKPKMTMLPSSGKP